MPQFKNFVWDKLADSGTNMNTVFHGVGPHERFFIRTLYLNELKKNPELAPAFKMFAVQYYPDYKWISYSMDDDLGDVVFEASRYDFLFKMAYEKMREVDLTDAMSFGEIATDFLIRFRNYSLVGCCGQNVIITAQSDCHKRFEKLLSEGYSLIRKAKVGFVETPGILKDEYPEVKGYFYKLPVFPTRDIGYPIDEIIEGEDQCYHPVMQLTKKI